MDYEKQLSDIFSDKKFVESLLGMKTLQEAQDAFKQKGIEIGEKDLKEVGKFLADCVKNRGGNLSDEQLEQISGGTNCVVRWTGRILSFPFATVGYTAGAILAGFPRGIYDGFTEAWYYDVEEKPKN